MGLESPSLRKVSARRRAEAAMLLMQLAPPVQTGLSWALTTLPSLKMAKLPFPVSVYVM